MELEGTEYVRIATVLRLRSRMTRPCQARDGEEHRAEVSPVGRALAKYLTLVPAERAGADRSRPRAAAPLAGRRAFEHVDVLAWPTVPAPAPPIEDPRVQLPSGPVPADYANVRQGGIGNLTGVPALSAPCGFTRAGLPVGLHLIDALARGRTAAGRGRAAGAGHGPRYVDAVPPIAQKTPV